MNIGILGFAHGHVGGYCSEWQAHPEMDMRLAAGWDSDPARLRKPVDTYGIQVFPSPEALLADRGIDAVVIAAETSEHARLVELAAAAGKGVILQKPIALTLEEADRIVAAVEKSGIAFTLAWQMRVDPQNLQIKEILQSGVLGRVFMVRRRHGLATHTWKDFDKAWHVNPKLNRDIWADDAAHPFDFIYWLMGMPAGIYAEISSLLNPRIPNDNGIAVFRYADGRLAEVTCSFTCVAGENTTEIVGEKGVLIQSYGDGPSAGAPRAPGAAGLKWFLQETGKWTVSDIPSPSGQWPRITGLAGPLAEFLHGRRPAIASAAEGRDVLRMILASYEANETGRRVSIQ